MQYQVLLDPNRLFAYGVTVPQVFQQLSEQQRQRRRRLLFAGRPVLLHPRPGPGARHRRTSATSSLRTKNGIPIYVKDVAKVEIGHAPRLGQFGYMKQDDAVEGVILMRVGEQAQVMLKRVEEMTKDLNEHVLPPDVKIVPYYDRRTDRGDHARPWSDNLLRGMLLVLVILGSSCSACARR